MYSPCPESVEPPLTYRTSLLNAIYALRDAVPDSPHQLTPWLGACAGLLSELARDPSTPEQPWACHALLADALFRRHGLAICFAVINERLLTR